MINLLRHKFLIICFAFLVTLLCANSTHAAIGDYTLVCGQTPNGQDIECDTAERKCVVCTQKQNRWIWTGVVPMWVGKKEQRVFKCLSKDAPVGKGCSVTTKGGRKGASETKFLGFLTVNKNAGQECVPNNFKSLYTSSCFGCEIVETLASAFVKAAAKAYNVAREAANAILIVATMIWVAIFVLKNISSFATVEPRQMIQQLLIQGFKVLLAFVIINSGIQTILHYTLEPIMLFGTDFADAIMEGTTPGGGS